jgi:hypothetical protein
MMRPDAGTVALDDLTVLAQRALAEPRGLALHIGRCTSACKACHVHTVPE